VIKTAFRDSGRCRHASPPPSVCLPHPVVPVCPSVQASSSALVEGYIQTYSQRHTCRFKDCTGKNIEILEKEKAAKAALEGQTRIQAEVNSSLAEQLAAAQDAAAAAQALAEARGGDTAGLRQRVATLETAVAAAENRVQELEIVRRKLHNTILVSF
jgi:chromosome segregation ATPase